MSLPAGRMVAQAFGAWSHFALKAAAELVADVAELVWAPVAEYMAVTIAAVDGTARALRGRGWG